MGGTQQESLGLPLRFRRAKWGVILGAFLAGLLVRQFFVALVPVGWIIGGLVGAELVRKSDRERLPWRYSMANLSLSLVVIVSEALLLARFTQLEAPVLDILVGAVGLITLLIFLSSDSILVCSYNFLLVFGTVGLATLVVSTIIYGFSLPPNGSTSGTTTEQPTETDRPLNGPPGPSTTQTPTTTPKRVQFAPGWEISLRLEDNSTRQYYADRWTFYSLGDVGPPVESAPHWPVLYSSNTFRLDIEQHDREVWAVRRDQGAPLANVSRWVFVAENISKQKRQSGYVTDELSVSSQQGLEELVVRRYIQVYMVAAAEPPGETGATVAAPTPTPTPTPMPTPTPTPMPTPTQTVTQPPVEGTQPPVEGTQPPVEGTPTTGVTPGDTSPTPEPTETEGPPSQPDDRDTPPVPESLLSLFVVLVIFGGLLRWRFSA